MTYIEVVVPGPTFVEVEASTGAPGPPGPPGPAGDTHVPPAPTGELGGTWDATTVDATHSGTSHAEIQDAAIGAAQIGLTAHVAAADPHTGYATDTDLATHAALPHGGGGGVVDATYLVGAAHAGLSAEIVVGATPGGELGGSWAAPTVDATHSGSAHHNQAHSGTGADHTYSGLTTGHVLTATSATAAAFQAAAGGGAPTTADYLVGTAQGGLSAEIVVGTTPGGELGGTWASPTVDSVHAGSAHLALGSTSATAAAGDHTHAGGGSPGLPWIAALWYPAQGTNPLAGVAVLNRAYAVPIYIPAAYVIDGIGMIVMGAVTSASGRLGIYSDATGRPGTLLYQSAGSHNWAGAGFGNYAVSPTQNLGPGWYWVVLVGQVAAPNVLTYGGINAMAALGSTVPSSTGGLQAGYGVDGITGALPASWGTPATWYETRVPAVYLRRA